MNPIKHPCSNVSDRYKKINPISMRDLFSGMKIKALLSYYHSLNSTKSRSDSVIEFSYYFAHPYCSWEKGSIEHANKLIRQYVVSGRKFI